MEQTPLLDRVALVTGGGRGLGQTIGHRLAREGAHVIVSDINEETAQATAAEIAEATGRQTLAVQANVTDEAQVEMMVKKAVEKFKRLDILVANAGIVISKDVLDFPTDQWRSVIDVNLIGYFLSAKYAAQVMKEQGSGVIIQINSIAGTRGSYRNSAYVASKMAGIGLTECLALDLVEYGIRVNAICPNPMLDSPLFKDSLFAQYAKRYNTTEEEVREQYVNRVPMKRTCTFDDVCNVVVFLASDQSSYLTGEAIRVTGGQR